MKDQTNDDHIIRLLSKKRVYPVLVAHTCSLK